jgi:flagellar basal-body rod modification protein FlgD
VITSAVNSTRTNVVAAAATASSAATQAAAPGGDMGKDQFMKLLIAQMQNQDPMDPMQGDQMAAQLAQFSSLEQLQEINTTLSTQSSASGSLLGAVQSGAAINTIGHSVVAIGNQVQLGSGGSSTVTADIGGTGGSATLHILDGNGKEVGTRSLGVAPGGRQTFDIGGAGDGLPAGTYSYSIDVKDGSGTAVPVQTYTTGRVTGISSGASGLVLNIGDVQVPYTNVVQVLN